MRHGILHDEGLDPIRMRQGHTIPHRSAVVLHVKCVAREPERLGEMSHDLRVVIEAVRELLWIRPIAVPEARVVGSYKVKAIGKARVQRLEHARRRRQSVQQLNRGRVLRARLPIEDRKPVNRHIAMPDVLRRSHVQDFLTLPARATARTLLSLLS